MKAAHGASPFSFISFIKISFTVFVMMRDFFVGYKVDIDSTGRDFFFSPSGNNDFSGKTIQNSVADPNTAINLINSLVPPTDGFNPASLNAAVSGDFSSGLVLPSSTTVNCASASIATTDPITIETGSRQSIFWGSLANFSTDGIVCMIDGQLRVLLGINALVVGNDGAFGAETFDNFGVKIKGNCQDIFIEVRQIALLGNRAIALEHTATTSTPIIYKIEKAEFFNEDQTMIRIEDGATERVEIEIDTIKRATAATKPTTNSLIFDVVSGQINVRATSLDADILGRVGDNAQLGITANICTGELQIQDGGECLLRTGVLVGAITVDEGGRLECIINVQVGTITNNGTINGIINGIPYGNWRQKHEEKVVLNASDSTSQIPVGTDNPLQITFGSAQFGPSDPVELSAAGAVTINESDQYNVLITFQYGRTGASGGSALLFFRVLVDGTQFGGSLYAALDNPNQAFPVEFTAPINLLATQVLTVEIWRDSGAFNAGELIPMTPVLGGTNSAPSAAITLTRNRLTQPEIAP